MTAEPGEPVEILLDVSDGTRFLEHPLHVIWKVTQAGRTIEIPTEDLKLAHYFRSSGDARVSAVLAWRDQTIDVQGSKTVTVQRDPAFN
jgi:hypothetical protein